jgi:Domain of unknown function (DUF4326)
MTRVVHCKRESFDIYIGRPGKWGNPFTLGEDGNREEVIYKYTEWILNQRNLLDNLLDLDGKILGCWCHPKLCHGDVLIELIKLRKEGLI